MLSPELSEQDLTRKQDAILDFVKKYKGKVESTDVWGRKPLAYKITKFSEAFYVFYTVTLPKENVQKFDNDIHLMEGVIRYLIVIHDAKAPVVAKPAEAEAPVATE